MHIERSKNIFISILVIVVEFPIFQFHVNVIPFFRFYLFLQNFLLPLLDCQWFRIKLSVPSLPPFFRYSLSSLYPSSLPSSLLIPSLNISQLIFDRINRVILPLKALNTALKHRYSYIDTKRKKYETIDLMFHRTSRFVFPFELTIDIRYLNVFTFCLWMEFGRDARKDNIYIYLFRGFNDARAQYLKINQVSLQLIEISKVWPFMHGILSFHEYMHPRYIYIYQYFPSRGKYERWNKDPSSKQSSSTESIFQNHFHYSRVSLAMWDANNFWKKKCITIGEEVSFFQPMRCCCS